LFQKRGNSLQNVSDEVVVRLASTMWVSATSQDWNEWMILIDCWNRGHADKLEMWSSTIISRYPPFSNYFLFVHLVTSHVIKHGVVEMSKVS
jgi:hypothetical protein